jgi:hypothetical protein
LLANKAGATRLGFAVLLKTFQFEGRFPDRREDVTGSIVAHLGGQVGVSLEAYIEGEWSERTQRLQRAQIRRHCGFRPFRTDEEPTFLAWSKERVLSPDPDAEPFKIVAYGHLRAQRLVSFPLNYYNGSTDSKDVSRFLNSYNCAVLNTIIP